jgi:hypothetical protein
VFPAEATSDAHDIGPLLIALWQNRNMIKDSTRKQEYIDNVRKVQDDIVGLFNNLPDKGPDPPSECSKTSKRSVDVSYVAKRSIISGIMDALDSVAKLLSCAVKVISNLVDEIQIPDPPIIEIETLTDMLNDLGNALKNEQTKPSDNKPSNSDSQPSTQKEQSSTTPAPSSISSESSKSSSASSSSSSSSSTSEFYCGAACASGACQIPGKAKRTAAPKPPAKQPATKRTLDDLEDWNFPGGFDEYVDMIVTNQQSRELDWNHQGIFIVSQDRVFDKEPHADYIQGIQG